MERGNGNNPTISIIIPAYNEDDRLPLYLDSIRSYFSNPESIDYEILVVDDGSSDGLLNRLANLKSEWPQLHFIQHHQNQGKGAAIRSGILQASGEMLLFCDADGATPIQEEKKLRSAIESGAGLAIGSRNLPSHEVMRHRSWPRKILGKAFAFLSQIMTGINASDPQCGFKMFRKDVGVRLFSLCDEPRYLFDLQLLILASRFDYTIKEVPVNWHEVSGSKVFLFRDGFRMLWKLATIRRRVAGILKEAGRPALLKDPAVAPERKKRLSSAGPLKRASR